MNLCEHVTNEFQRRFGEPPRCVVRAPGRVNLIGEHTDYNDGFVLPMAIDRATWIALRPRDDAKVVLHSLDHNEPLEFSLANLQKRERHWGEYPKAVAWALVQAGHRPRGWEGVSGCDVPMAAGLSSSASFELAVARAFAAVTNIVWDPATMAKLCQRAENQWVGVNCGIMDQMISACGRAGHALLIDCRSLETRPVLLPRDTVVVVLDTGTRRGLVDSAYNERRAQCETAARYFGVRALRDVSLAEFEKRAGSLDELPRRRARHVITENERTLAAAAKTTDPVALGKLMNASHNSLRDDFEVTNKELNTIVECAHIAPGCCGARMTGAGFGGCAVALVRDTAVDRFVETARAEYHQKTLLAATVYVCRPTNGAEVVS
jgi:galactokinase